MMRFCVYLIRNPTYVAFAKDAGSHPHSRMFVPCCEYPMRQPLPSEALLLSCVADKMNIVAIAIWA